MSAPLSQPSGRAQPVDAERQRLEHKRLERLSADLGAEGLAWLAVAPTWTLGIARAASFPTGELPLDAWVQRAEAGALVEQEPEKRANPTLGREFWIAESDRSLVIDFLKSNAGLGDHGIRRVTAEVARRLQYADSGPELPEALDRWAALALGAEQPAAAARRLESEVERLTQEHRLGEARAAVTAGDALARTLGGAHLGNAVDLGQRRLEIAYREAGDERHLRRYFAREAQERAFEAILDERSPAWALHYLGMGGIGKTMLLRRITSQIARQRELAVSRIDFDQLSPDYPVRRPGQLLLALAIELRPHVGSAGQRLATFLANATIELHELLGAEPPPDDPLRNVTRPEFEKLLQIFADLLRSVPRRVVLLLDTCEELARVPVVNQMLPAVEATFAVLTRVHDEAPSVRVVLAGRRPLASSGHGWSLREIGSVAALDPTLGLRPFLPERPFLALHEILGFSADEAHRFLTGPWGLALQRGDPLERAILERSVETGRAVAFVRTPGEATTLDDLSDGPSSSNEPLYSPFDLSLYGGWLTEDPTLGPADIAGRTTGPEGERARDGDPYVEVRIVQRIQPVELRSALPAIVALGRIDEQTLAEALPEALPADAVSDLYRALADHEWMEQQRDPHTGQLFLEVEPHLLPRLREYYAHDLRAAEAGAARRRVAPRLEQAIRTLRLGELSVHQIDAALALLPAPSAASLWTEVLVRVPAETEWSWLRNVTERVLGGDGALSRQPSLAAGLTAASIALQLHLAGAVTAAADDIAVARWPDEGTRPWIARLHRLWSIDAATPADRAAEVLVELIDGFVAVPVAEPDGPHLASRRRSEAEAGALIAAIESHADRAPLAASREGRSRVRLAEALTAWADVLAAHEYPRTLVAMAEITAARLRAAADRGDEAAILVERALETVHADRPEPDRPWLFWRHPESVVDRVRLEALSLHRDYLVGPPPDALSWLAPEDAAPPRYATDWLRVRTEASEPSSLTATIDGERLVSALEQWWLDRALPARDELGSSEAMDRYIVDRQPSAAVHRRTPPLFVTLARKRAAIGDFEGADKRLRDRWREAEASRQDAETVRIATIARLEIARAGRSVPDDLPAAVRGLDAGLRERSDARPAFALRTLTGVDLTDGFVPAPRDGWAVSPPGSESRGRATDVAVNPEGAAAGAPVYSVATALDAVEALIVSGAADAPAPRLPVRAERAVDPILRAMLRMYALRPRPELVSGVVEIAAPIARLLTFVEGETTADGDQPLQPVDLRGAATALAGYLAARTGQPPLPVTGPDPGPGPQRLLHIVGARRLATIAQDEGELLALQLPEQGARLLDLAAGLASRAADDVAFLHATIAEALALGRSGGAKPLGAPVSGAWARVTGGAPPSLEEVATWWSEHAMVSPAYERRPSGWQMRYAIAAELGTNPGARAQLARSKSAWVRAFTAFDHSPELAFVFAEDDDGRSPTTAGPATANADASAPPPAPTSARPSMLDQALAIGIGLLSLVVLLWLVGTGALVFPFSSRAGGEPGLGTVALVLGGVSLAMVLLRTWRPTVGDAAIGGAAFLVGFSVYYALFGAVADWMLPVPLGNWQRFGLVFGLLALVGVIPSAYMRVWSWWKSWVARRSVLAIRIEAPAAPNLRSASTTPAPATVSFTLARVRTAGWRLPVHEPVIQWSRTLDLPTVVRGSYGDAAAVIDRGALGALPEIRADLGGAEWMVPVLIDRADQLPWEGLLAHALAGSHAPEDAVFFYRAARASDFEQRQGGLAIGVVSVLGASPDAVGVWQKADWALAGEEARGSPVVHAIGTPVLGSAGPQFRLADRGAFEQKAWLESPVAESPASAVSLSELGPTSLLILQQEPAFSNARFGTDREQAALLRVVAGELSQRGHLAVLTIPSLEPELADVVLTAIARRLREKPSLRRMFAARTDFANARRHPPEEFLSLAHAVRDARRALTEWLVTHGNALEAALDDRVEAAWDICLFARYSEGPVRGPATATRSEHD